MMRGGANGRFKMSRRRGKSPGWRREVLVARGLAIGVGDGALADSKARISRPQLGDRNFVLYSRRARGATKIAAFSNRDWRARGARDYGTPGRMLDRYLRNYENHMLASIPDLRVPDTDWARAGRRRFCQIRRMG